MSFRLIRTILFIGLLALCPFVGLAQYQVNGNAVQDQCNCYTLTAAQNSQAGSVWNINKIDLTNSFDYNFEVYLGCNESGADGIAFALQPVGTSVGNLGGGMGLEGVAPSVGIYIDTYRNQDPDQDPVADHIAIQANGDVTHDANANDLTPAVALPQMEDCSWHDFHVTWDATSNTLEGFVDDVLYVSYTGDIVSSVFGGDPMVYWGFTGSTGGLNNEQKFCTKLQAQFSLPNTYVCPNTDIQFLDVSETFTGVTSWQWNFGDGNSSTDANPTHAFSSEGTYTVTLTVEDATGCSDTYSFDVVVANIDLSVSATPDEVCVGNVVQLEATVTPPPLPACTYQLKLFDSYGDGWNGASIDVLEAGTNIGNFSAAGTGAIHNFSITHSNAFSLFFNGGTFNSECSYELYDPMGGLLASGNLGAAAGTTIYSGTGDCNYTAPTYAFAWDPDSLVSDPAIANPTYTPGESVSFTVTVTDPASGCEGEESVNVIVNVLDVTPAIVDDPCRDDDNVTVTLNTAQGEGPYSFDLDGTVSSNNTFENMQPGTFNYSVTDANGCLANGSVTVDPPNPPLSLSLDTKKDVLCFGDCNGTIDVIGSGGLAPITFNSGNGPQNSGSFSSLCAGNYSITLVDAIGCDSAISVEILEPLELEISEVDLIPSTCGNCNGEITVAISGGTSPYTIVHDGTTSPTGEFTGICSGEGVVTVEDANGCTAELDFEMVDQAGFSISIVDVDDISCNGLCDGEVRVKGEGGTEPFEFSVGGPYVTGTTFSDLCAGDYTVLGRDANGCMFPVDFTIEEPPVLVAGLKSKKDVSCFGACDGELELTVSGGVEPYDFSPEGSVSDSVYKNLCAGDYSITIQDKNDCQQLVEVSISEPAVLSSVASTDMDASTATSCDGAVSVVVTGGEEPYTYDWNNAGSTPDQSSTSGLCGGNYCVDVTDANGCTTQACAVVDEPPGIDMVADVAQLTCRLSADGSIDVTVQGGVPPYVFAWTGPNGFTSADEDLSDLEPGDYHLILTDKNGATGSLDASIDAIPAFSATISGKDSVCFGMCDGTVFASVTGGSLPYNSIAWTGPNGFNEQGADVPSGIMCPGVYTLTVLDKNNCQFDSTYVVEELDEFQFANTQIDPNCGKPDGELQGTVSMTFGDAHWTWLDANNVQIGNSDTVSGVPAGTYFGAVVDDFGCSDTSSLTLVDIPGGQVVINSTSDFNGFGVSCFNECDGEIVVSMNGGTAPFSYDMGNGGQASPQFTGLCEGSYTITATDDAGCVSQVSQTITEPSQLAVVDSIIHESCENLCNGEMYLKGVGGVGGYQFRFDTADTFMPNNSLQDLCPMAYAIGVRDNNQCVENRIVVVQAGDPFADATIDPVNPFCANDAPMQMTAQDPGGVWVGQGIVDENTGEFDPRVAGEGTFVVQYEIRTQCGDTAQEILVVNPLPDVAFDSDIFESCAPLSVNLVNTGDRGDCQWIINNQSAISTCDTVPYTFSQPGIKSVSLRVTNSFGCVGLHTEQEYLQVYPNPIADYNYYSLGNEISDFRIRFENISTDADSYVWFLDSIQFSDEENPEIQFPDSGWYNSHLVAAQTYNGITCTDTAYKRVYVKDYFSFFVPNAFSPNGDGVNDVFKAYFNDDDPLVYDFSVFDRWGEQLFHTSKVDAGWNGRVGGDLVQPDVYVWHILIRDGIEREPKKYFGTVNLIR